MRVAILVSGVVLLALVAAGCGGALEKAPAGAATPAGPSAATTAEKADNQLRVSKSGWRTDFSRHTVPLSEFLGGGPGKDGIPAIDDPMFVSRSEAADWIGPREPVVQLELGGDARAYPLQILIWHEIVNDTLAGVPVAVTFCPLCNTALAFDRRIADRVLDFGTTGNLRNSDLVMYDRQTESWWQQFGGEAIVGDLAGEKLRQVPAGIVAFEDFAREYPDAKVLSRDTGFSRPYGENPYFGYDDVGTPPFFPAANPDDKRLPPKERVVFIERGGEVLVVPFSVLAKEKRIEVEVGGERLEVVWLGGVRSALDSPAIAQGRAVGSARVRSAATGKPALFDTPFWFSVAAFRPDARVWAGGSLTSR